MPDSTTTAAAEARPAGAPLHAVVGELPSAAALYHAAEVIRDRGFTRWEVFSPFPVHGMDDAMGLKKSPLGYLVFFGGLTGAIVGFSLEVYTSVFDYPLIVQGKPYLSLPAFFPIIFELTILLSAFTTVFGLLLLTRLPCFHHPMFNWDQFRRVSDDAFFVAIESSDPKFSEAGARKLLEEVGATNISAVGDEP